MPLTTQNQSGLKEARPESSPNPPKKTRRGGANLAPQFFRRPPKSPKLKLTPSMLPSTRIQQTPNHQSSERNQPNSSKSQRKATQGRRVKNRCFHAKMGTTLPAKWIKGSPASHKSPNKKTIKRTREIHNFSKKHLVPSRQELNPPEKKSEMDSFS